MVARRPRSKAFFDDFAVDAAAEEHPHHYFWGAHYRHLPYPVLQLGHLFQVISCNHLRHCRYHRHSDGLAHLLRQLQSFFQRAIAFGNANATGQHHHSGSIPAVFVKASLFRDCYSHGEFLPSSDPHGRQERMRRKYLNTWFGCTASL